MKYSNLMKVLDICCKNKTLITIKWNNGCIFKSNRNYGSSEAYTTLDENDDAYKEYFACIVNILEIIQYPVEKQFAPQYGKLAVGSYLEISSEFNEPFQICSESGTIIWEKS